MGGVGTPQTPPAPSLVLGWESPSLGQEFGGFEPILPFFKFYFILLLQGPSLPGPPVSAGMGVLGSCWELCRRSSKLSSPRGEESGWGLSHPMNFSPFSLRGFQVRLDFPGRSGCWDPR